MLPFFLQDPEADQETLDALYEQRPASFLENVVTSASQGIEDMPVNEIQRELWFQEASKMPIGPKTTDKTTRWITPDEYKKSTYYRPGINFPKGERESVIKLTVQQHDKQVKRDEVFARVRGGGKVTSLATQFLMQLADPINLGVSFIPVISQARYAGWLAKYGKTMSRFGKGVVEGATGSLMLEPLHVDISAKEQEDYGMADALVNTAFGGLMGGGLHLGVGKLSDVLEKTTQKTREEAGELAVRQMLNDEHVDVTPVLDRDPGMALPPAEAPEVAGAEIYDRPTAGVPTAPIRNPDPVALESGQFRNYASNRNSRLSPFIGPDKHLLESAREPSATLVDIGPEVKVKDTAEGKAIPASAATEIQTRNAGIKQTLLDTIKNGARGPYETLKSLLVGTTKSRMSTDLKGITYSKKYVGGLFSDLERAGVLDLAKNGDMEPLVIRELHERGSTGNKNARKIAEIIEKWQDETTRGLNKAGAHIEKLEGYITRQVHNADKIRRAGFQAWRDVILPLLDEEKTFNRHEFAGPVNPDKFLLGAYNGIVTGRHYKFDGGEYIPANLGKDLADKVSAERILHFRDGESWYAYNQQFGDADLMNTVLHNLEKGGYNTALMEDWGTNPTYMFESILEDLKDHYRNTPDVYAQVSGGKEHQLRNYLKQITGETRVPVSPGLAKGAATVRSWLNMSKLGGAVISSITDLGTTHTELLYNGVRMLDSITQPLMSTAQSFSRTADQKAFLHSVGAGLEGMRGAVASRYTPTDILPTKMAKAQHTFFRYSGMNWWNDAGKEGIVHALAANLEAHTKLSFDKLPPELRNVLGIYDINAKDWDLIRQAETVEMNGYRYVAPDAMQDLPDDIIKKTYPDKDPAAVRDDLSVKVRAYLIDRADYAVPTPHAAEAALLYQGTQPGTVLGETVRFFAQFKMFPTTFVTKVLGREIYGKQGALPSIIGLVDVMLATTALGYLAMTAKDISKGRKPREATPKTFLAAFQQGGGAGIMGDFLFGAAKSRYGTGLWSTVLGPAASTVEEIVKTRSKAAAVKTIMNNTPYVNMFYTRFALDYLMLWRIQEWLNPGYLNRYERNIKDMNDQEFFISPFSAIQ